MTNHYPLICGHRGGGGDVESVKALTAGVDWSHLKRAPDHYDYRTVWENRLRTFDYMISKGVRCFELDLLPSKNGDAMMIHDSEIDGRPVWQWTTAELRQKGYSPLEDLLDLIEKNGKEIILLLELKGLVSSEQATDSGESGISEHSARLVEKAVHIIGERVSKHGWSYDRLPLIGFNHAMLAMAKKMNPEILIGLSYAKESEPASEQMIENANTLSAYAINPDNRLITPELVKKSHERGLRVQSWAPYRAPELPLKMIELNVDTLITDFPLETAKYL